MSPILPALHRFATTIRDYAERMDSLSVTAKGLVEALQNWVVHEAEATNRHQRRRAEALAREDRR